MVPSSVNYTVYKLCVVIHTKQDDQRKSNCLLCARVCVPGIHSLIYYNKPRILLLVICVSQVVAMATITCNSQHFAVLHVCSNFLSHLW